MRDARFSTAAHLAEERLRRKIQLRFTIDQLETELAAYERELRTLEMMDTNGREVEA